MSEESLDERYVVHLKTRTNLTECAESLIPQMKEKVNRTWGIRAEQM